MKWLLKRKPIPLNIFNAPAHCISHGHCWIFSFFFFSRTLIKLSHNQMIESCHPQFCREIRFYWIGEWLTCTRTQGTNTCTPLVSGLHVLSSVTKKTPKKTIKLYVELSYIPLIGFSCTLVMLLIHFSGVITVQMETCSLCYPRNVN